MFFVLQSTPVPLSYHNKVPDGSINTFLSSVQHGSLVSPSSVAGFSSYASLDSIAETLRNNGNQVKKMRMPSDLKINSGNGQNFTIRKDEECLLIKTPKGLYLRTYDGRIINITRRNPARSQPMRLPQQEASFGVRTFKEEKFLKIDMFLSYLKHVC